jgi:hypothetical protein
MRRCLCLPGSGVIFRKYFRRKQNARTAHISYEHWRESDHDDLVLAAALACWKANYKRKGSTRLKLIR